MARSIRRKPTNKTRQPRNMPHLASRLFGVPLLIDGRKLDAIVPVFLNKVTGQIDSDLDADEAREPAEMTVDVQSSIAVIPVIGSLIRRPTWLDAYSGLTSYGEIAESLECALNDARVSAILLQIDSFGGEAGGCFELCDKIYAARAKKPVWAVADIDAMSAGYAILSSAERCFVAPQGSCGSIGVVSVHLERSQQNEMMGLTYTVFRAGDRKAEFNPYEKLTPDAAEKMLTSIEKTRQTFAETISRNRSGLALETIMGTEGQWYDGDEGLSLGLIDGVMTYEAVFAELAATISAPSQPPAPPPEPEAPAEDEPETEPADEPEDGNNGNVMELSDMATQNGNGKPPAPPAPVVTATAPVPAVVELDAARGGEKSLAYQISDICKVAGHPHLAADFIMNETSLADVRAKLTDLNAKRPGNDVELNNSHPGGNGGGNPQNPFAPAQPTGSGLESWGRHFKTAQATNPRGFPVGNR